MSAPARVPRLRGGRAAAPRSAPRYELRTRRRGPADSEYEVWQLPAPATPHIAAPLRVAGLRGRNLELVEHRVLKRLSRAGVKPGRAAARGCPLDVIWRWRWACCSARWRRCAAATTCARWRRG